VRASDVHKATVVAGVRVPGPRPGERRGETKTFATTTRGLRELTDWLIGHGVTDVAMESTACTGGQCMPRSRASCRRPRERTAREMVPGRKTDVKDCEWLAQCSNAACLRGSFVPPRAGRDLRIDALAQGAHRERGHHVNRIEKTLELAQIKIGCVVTDLMGKTGRAISRR